MRMLHFDGRVDPHFGFPDPCRTHCAFEHFDAVLFTENAAVDEVVAIAGDQLVVTLDTRETLEMVDVTLGPHDELTGGNHLATGVACTAVAE